MANLVRVVAAVLDTAKLTLYKQNGDTIVLQQGDVRIRPIIDEVTSHIAQHGYADVDLSHPELEQEGNAFAAFEEQSKKVRFFRVAKNILKTLFGMGNQEDESHVESVVVGQTSEATIIASEPVAIIGRESVSKGVIDEIMAHAVSTSDPTFTEEGLDKQAPITEGNGVTPDAPRPEMAQDTIIAVTTDNAVIPGMEKIKSQFARAAKLGSTEGIEKFLARLGKVIHERRHSVEDLLKFLERADLPIADDGTIIIYKVLRHASDEIKKQYPKAKYVDDRTKKVPQWIGSRVQMAISLVDPSRSQDCSNGLHVARRGYLSSFGGDMCVIAKLAPEDVIAVPQYNSNKMRVCGYNIIFEVSPEHYAMLRQNQPLTQDSAGGILLAKAIKGQHTGVTDIVEITENLGGGIQHTSCQKVEPKLEFKPVEPTTALQDASNPPKAPSVDPAAVVREVEAAVKESRNDKVHRLVVGILEAKNKSRGGINTSQEQLDLWGQLEQIKKSAKVGWDRLNVPAQIVERMTKLVEKQSTIAEAPELSQSEMQTTTPAVVPAKPGSHHDRIMKLAAITPMSRLTAHSILDIQKTAKKGWAALKIPDEIVSRVLELTDSK